MGLRIDNNVSVAFGWPVALLCGVMAAGAVGSRTVLADDKPATIDFSHDVVPILRQNCFECHGGSRSEGGFSINTRELILDAGVAEPGDATSSYLVDLITADDNELRMPPVEKNRLADAESVVLRQWIDQGLTWQEGFSFALTGYEPPIRLRRPELPPPSGEHENPVDRVLNAYLGERGISPFEPVSDHTFARRAHLDLIGMLPPPKQLAEFLESADVDKRKLLIDKLLADRQAYAEHWLTFWNDLLRNEYVGTGYIDGGRQQISGWLYRALLENLPYDQFTRELIAPTEESAGFINGIKWRGNVNASQRRELQFAQNIAQVLLGMNLKCASCHDSFIDRWTLEETYSLAAVYAEEPLELHRCDKATGKIAEPAWMFPELGAIDPRAPRDQRLKQLADLIVDRENGLFARTIVNRLWHQFMGRGIIHPMEAMQNEPFLPDLLDFLAVDFVDHGYDLKHTMRLIASSQAYQTQPVSVDESELMQSYVFTGPVVKRMTAEQFLDAIWQVTQTGPHSPHKSMARFLPATADRTFYRASLLESDLLMRSLGRPNREQVVTSRPTTLTKLQALELFNSQLLTDTLQRGAENILQRYSDWRGSQLVDHIYWAALSRSPTETEARAAEELLKSPASAEGMEDLLWVVIMLPEFQLVR